MPVSSPRIGFLGGTFNPIHYGHLRAAEETAESLDLNRVLFIPSAHPPHKDPSPLVPVRHRLKMAELAVAGRPGFAVSDIEARRGGPSWTVDTLTHFRRQYGPRAGLFFLCGVDAFLEVHTWKEYRRLFSLVCFVVFTRPGAAPEELGAFLAGKVSPRYTWDPGRGAYTCPGRRRVYFRPVSRLDISSTDVRRRVAEGRSVRYLIPEPVRRYIARHGLYHPEGERKE
ncbi:MAG: nicotinate-nucleotide adenylyltransferase [Thermodesulfobacteriota bacterium]